MILPLLLLACGPDATEQGADADPNCDPIDPSVCLLPFPSSYFLEEDDTETGVRVAFGPSSLPTNVDGVAWDPEHWNEKDGFSVSASLMTWFDDVSLAGTIRINHPEDYQNADARTVIIDTVTGERVPHFVELDASIEAESQRVLILRPLVILEYGRRYVVGIRGLDKQSGGPVDVSEAFDALKKSDPSGLVSKARQKHFDREVFPVLSRQGFVRGELQLAWDFTTVSRHNSLGRMEWMREDLYDRIGKKGPDYTIDRVEDGDCTDGHIARTIVGHMTVPLYTDIDGPGAILTRDDTGWPFYNGDTRPDFELQIPCSVAADPHAAPVIQLGHGFFGTKSEAHSGFLRELADSEGWNILATDWTGMSAEDQGGVTLMFAENPSRFAMVPERSFQGFIEALAASRLMAGDFGSDPAVTYADSNNEDVSVIDPDTRYYYGISMGGILGGAYVAMSPDIERAVLSVSGTPFSMLTARSVNFTPFFLLLNQKYDDGRVISVLPPVVQMLWDPAESAGWVYEMTRNPAPGMPKHHILMQTALGDSQVTTLGGQLQARSYGASLVKPATRPVFGMTEKKAPFKASALVEWNYTDVAKEPLESVPATIDGNTHGCPRNEPLGMEQVAIFLNTGRVEQTCNGECRSTLKECQ